MKQLASFSAGIAAALIFWYFILKAQLNEGMAGRGSDHPFLPLFFVSCLILLGCYTGVSWLLSKDRRPAREGLAMSVFSFAAGLAVSVVFWLASAFLIITFRRPGVPTGNWLFPFLFLGLLAFFAADRFAYRFLQRRSATRHLQH